MSTTTYNLHLKGVLTDEEILKAAHAFWFADKDYKGNDKIWCYT